MVSQAYRNTVEGFQGMAQACGRLVLANDFINVTCAHAENPSLKCKTSSKIPDRQHYNAIQSSVAAFSVSGLLGPAPDESHSIATSFQEISINGVPVVNTAIHSRVEHVYTRLCRPNTRISKQLPEASYILRLAIPADLVVFTGPVLKRTAMMPVSSPLQGLLAQCLIRGWRESMPSALLIELESSTKQLESSDPPPRRMDGLSKQPHLERDQTPPASAPLDSCREQRLDASSRLPRNASSIIPLGQPQKLSHSACHDAAGPGPYNHDRPVAAIKPQGSRIAMMKAKRVLARLSAPCLNQAGPTATATPVPEQV